MCRTILKASTNMAGISDHGIATWNSSSLDSVKRRRWGAFPQTWLSVRYCRSLIVLVSHRNLTPSDVSSSSRLGRWDDADKPDEQLEQLSCVRIHALSHVLIWPRLAVGWLGTLCFCSGASNSLLLDTKLSNGFAKGLEMPTYHRNISGTLTPIDTEHICDHLNPGSKASSQAVSSTYLRISGILQVRYDLD